MCGQYLSIDDLDQAPFTWRDRHRLTALDRNTTFESKTKAWKSLPWAASMLLTLVPGVFAATAVAKYVRRLMFTWGRASFVTCIGLDPRSGWVGMGTVISAVMTLLVQLNRIEWTVRGSSNVLRDQLQPDSFFQESEVFIEILVAAFVQDFLITLTSRVLFESLMIRLVSSRLILIIVFVLGVILSRYLRPRSLRVSRLSRRRWVVRAAGTISLVGFCGFVDGLQIFEDIAEALAITHGIVHPWNYLWEWPDPAWPSL